MPEVLMDFLQKAVQESLLEPQSHRNTPWALRYRGRTSLCWTRGIRFEVHFADRGIVSLHSGRIAKTTRGLPHLARRHRGRTASYPADPGVQFSRTGLLSITRFRFQHLAIPRSEVGIDGSDPPSPVNVSFASCVTLSTASPCERLSRSPTTIR